MLTQATALSLLEVAVPPDTALTISSEIKILEIVGIVSNPELVKSMKLVEALVPTTAPATLQGLVQLLSGLGKMNPKTPKSTHDALANLMQNLQRAPDVALTFGTFLPILRQIVDATPKRKSHEAERGRDRDSEEAILVEEVRESPPRRVRKRRSRAAAV